MIILAYSTRYFLLPISVLFGILCDIPILTEDPPRSLVLNVCGDMIHRTCAKTMYKELKMEHYFAHVAWQIIVIHYYLSNTA